MNMPFPGMDPYLEHPALWPGVHNRLLVAVANQLQPRLLPRYIASLEERVYVEGPQHEMIPDILVRQRPNAGRATAVAELEADKPVVLAVENQEIHESYVEILDRYAGMKVVTVIEVISPTNKVAGPGRTAYLRKQRETLAGERHVVEIDLLRRGRHILCIPPWRARDLGRYDYLTCVNRWPNRNQFELYPCRLPNRLPRIRVPLVEPDPDVPLDLQTALEQVYQEGTYMLRVRYDQRCEPRLRPADQRWANECWAAYRAAHAEWFPPATPG
jgi:hypothetical protein